MILRIEDGDERRGAHAPQQVAVIGLGAFEAADIKVAYARGLAIIASWGRITGCQAYGLNMAANPEASVNSQPESKFCFLTPHTP